MKNSIVSFSVKHPVSVMMIVTAYFLCGILSIFFTDISFLPKLKARELLITTSYEGISAEEMRTLVTIPVEESVSSLKGLKKCKSVTRDGVSSVIAELKWGTDPDLALISAKD